MITLNLDHIITLNPQQFFNLCRNNPNAKLELTAQGALVVMSPTGGESGNRNMKLAARLEYWTESDQTGLVFDSSTMFQLPNGAYRSPDASWIRLSRWQQLTPEEQKAFPPLCPDFVLELRSESDSLTHIPQVLEEAE